VIDGHGYAELITTKPFLYHRVWDADADKLNSVLEYGLERIASGYSGFWESRPGHVYMGDREKVLKIKPHDGPQEPDERSWALLSIDSSLLEPVQSTIGTW